MNCPWCDFSGAPRQLHAHLGESHSEAVRFEEKPGARGVPGSPVKSFYAIECPLCGSGYEHQIKPRGRDPGFVDEFAGQIRLVAFDMLVNHLLAEHEEGAASGAEPRQDSPPGPAVAGPGPAWLVEARRKAARERDEEG